MRRGKLARETRQQSAQTLKEKRDTKSIGEQLSILSRRPGGSIKERARLLVLIKEQKQ
jgi:hypothetical protein